jgi:5-methylcytosine-specific restriction endonuclease McrA
MPYLFGLLVLFVLGALAIQYWYYSLAIAILAVSPRVIRVIRKKRYFSSEVFLQQKAEISSVVDAYNEIAQYVNEIGAEGKFNIGHSESGSQSHLATTSNTSKYGYKRDRNVAEFGSSNVHNTSLQVVKNASSDPIKYLIKYFDIEASEEKLSEIESMGESISKLENGIKNLKEREASISTSINPPKFILKHYLKEFQEQIGLSVPEIRVPYPKYKFQYVSAGGNSSQETSIQLNSPTLDSLIETLSEKIKFKKSAAGQRSLMTAKFRDFIKQRDKYTCQICKISTDKEPHLLIEVDHIKPVSKGGLSTEENLQALCWKCNRTKSNKDI